MRNARGRRPSARPATSSKRRSPPSHALFRWKAGAHDHFVSRDKGCEGQTIEGLLGYALD